MDATAEAPGRSEEHRRRRWLDNYREEDPTPEEIARRAAEIRAEWSEEEHRIRWRFR